MRLHCRLTKRVAEKLTHTTDWGLQYPKLFSWKKEIPLTAPMRPPLLYLRFSITITDCFTGLGAIVNICSPTKRGFFGALGWYKWFFARKSCFVKHPATEISLTAEQ